MTDFKPGDEVVCVDNAGNPKLPSYAEWYCTPPHQGEIYIVRDVIADRGSLSAACLCLCGLPNHVTDDDWGFAHWRFRHIRYDSDEEFLRETTSDIIRIDIDPVADADYDAGSGGAFR